MRARVDGDDNIFLNLLSSVRDQSVIDPALAIEPFAAVLSWCYKIHRRIAMLFALIQPSMLLSTSPVPIPAITNVSSPAVLTAYLATNASR